MLASLRAIGGAIRKYWTGVAGIGVLPRFFLHLIESHAKCGARHRGTNSSNISARKREGSFMTYRRMVGPCGTGLLEARPIQRGRK